VKNYKLYNKKNQVGMTLIELTVVLLVLIGLAGLLIPYVSGFVQKTHDSTGTNNLARLNGNFARFENEFMRDPDNMESLINGAAGTAAATDTTCQAATANTIYCKMMYTGYWTPLQLNTQMVESLSSADITNVLDNDPDTANATFESVTGSRQLATSGFVATVDKALDPATGLPFNTVADHLADALGGTANQYDNSDGTFDGVDNCYAYVGFGVGDGNEMIGRTMNSAPIHFAQKGSMGAANKYNRFVAIYKVDKNNTAPCSTDSDRAKFIGSVMSMSKTAYHLWGVGHSAGHAYEHIANSIK